MNTKLYFDPSENKAFQWYSDNGVHFIGYFFDEYRTYRSGKQALAKIVTWEIADLQENLKGLDGIFSLVYESADTTFLYTDITRSFPLFYATINNSYHISNNPLYIARQQSNTSFDQQGVLEFLSTAFVYNNRTLLSQIKQVYPCELVSIKDVIESKTLSFFHPKHTFGDLPDASTLQKQLSDLLHQSGEETLSSLEQRPVLLPLSGGYDSRSIACMLKKYGYKNVIAFTYGRPGTAEAEISKKVAQQLGFRWYCIDYTDKEIAGYANEEMFQKYFHYASKATSMFYLQEYFAMRWLLKKDIIDNRFITLPGHGGIFAGSMLGKVVNESTPKNKIASNILSNYGIFAYLTKKEKKQLTQSIGERLNKPQNGITHRYAEDWLIKERYAKYIINSVSTHTFFGLEYRLPLCAQKLVDFFSELPYNLRITSILYHETLEDSFFAPMGVNYTSHQRISQATLVKQAVKYKLKPYLPLRIKDRYRIKHDWVFYNEATIPFLKELNNKSVPYIDNGIAYQYRILNWYLLKLRETLEVYP